MKIDFGKVIIGEDKLGQFLKEKTVYRGKHWDVQQFNYDLFGIEKSLVDILEEALGAGNVSRAKNNALWVSQPQQFFLSLSARLMGNDYGDIRYEYSIYELESKDLRLVGTRTVIEKVPKLFWGYRDAEFTVNISREIPKVIVAGSVVFEKLAGVDPVQLLGILKSAGYSSNVIPTSQEVIAAFERANRSNQDSYRRTNQASGYNNSDGALLGFGAGLLIGGLLD